MAYKGCFISLLIDGPLPWRTKAFDQPASTNASWSNERASKQAKPNTQQKKIGYPTKKEGCLLFDLFIQFISIPVPPNQEGEDIGLEQDGYQYRRTRSSLLMR